MEKKFFTPIGCQLLQNCPQNCAEIIPEAVHKIVSVEKLNVPAMKSYVVWKSLFETFLQSRSLWKTRQPDNKIDWSTLKSLICRRAWLLQFFRFFCHPARRFPPCSFIPSCLLRNLPNWLLLTILMVIFSLFVY